MRRSCLWARVGAPTAWPVPAHSASAPSVAASVDSELSSTTTQPSSVSLASLATIRPLPSGAVYSKPPETIFWPSSHGSVPPSTSPAATVIVPNVSVRFETASRLIS